jgi:hypothetical protein
MCATSPTPLLEQQLFSKLSLVRFINSDNIIKQAGIAQSMQRLGYGLEGGEIMV